MPPVKIPLTKAHKEQIKVALAIYDKCNQKEREFLDTCKKIAIDPKNWPMTEGRTKFLADIVKTYITGTDENAAQEYHNGNFHAYETNNGFQVYYNEIAIGECLARVEVVSVLAFLAHNIMGLLAAHSVTDTSADKLPSKPAPTQQVDVPVEEAIAFPEAEGKVVANDGLLYEDENSPSGYVDSDGIPVDEYCLSLESDDNFPFV